MGSTLLVARVDLTAHKVYTRFLSAKKEKTFNTVSRRIAGQEDAVGRVLRACGAEMRFLVLFRGIHTHFRVPELRCMVARARGCRESDLGDLGLIPVIEVVRGESGSKDAGTVLYGEVFAYVELESEEEAARVCRSCVLVRAMFVPVAHGTDYAECVAGALAEGNAALAPLMDAERRPTFRCVVDAFGRSLSIEQQLERIHRFGDLLASFPGKVRMKNSDFELWIMEDAFPVNGHGFAKTHKEPRQVLLGRKIAEGCASLGQKYSLKRRRYIGPTSMDAELSFIMANMAQVRPDALVMDPFCGTGGVMVACAVLGAHVIGADINLLALRGKGQGSTIAANFDQYGLTPPLALCRSDVLYSPFRRRRGGWLDAIVCDPPYGIKEGTRSFRTDTIEAHPTRNHFQATERVRFVDFLNGVLEFAAELLVPGGRIVYWLPTTPDYSDNDLPTHPALQILHNSEQPLTTRMSRRLITMVRVSERQREANEDAIMQERMNARRITDSETEHVPAHADLAAKLLRDPFRAEARLRLR